MSKSWALDTIKQITRPQRAQYQYESDGVIYTYEIIDESFDHEFGTERAPKVVHVISAEVQINHKSWAGIVEDIQIEIESELESQNE